MNFTGLNFKNHMNLKNLMEQKNIKNLMDPKRLRMTFILMVSAVLISGMTAYAEGQSTARNIVVLEPGAIDAEASETTASETGALGTGISETVAVGAGATNIKTSETRAIYTKALESGYGASGDEAIETGDIDTGISETGYRMKPLLDKLAAMDSAAVEACAGRFRDMEKHWSRQVVGKLAALDIIAGMGDGSFRPDNPVTADQFIKMAVMAMGHRIKQGAGYWAKPYIDAAMEEGIVLGGEFADYKKPLSREEMARIIVRTALKVEEAPGSEYDGYIIGKITDYESIDNSLKHYVLDGYKLGLVQGSNNKYHPKDTLTRAEATAVIIRILDRTERKPTVPGPDEIIRLVDNLGNPMMIYPGPIKEYFEIEKAMEKALPKAKGYAVLFYSPETGAVCVVMYRSYEAWKENSTVNKIAAFYSNNAYKDSDNPFAYTFCVWQKEPYRELFTDYVKEILKALYGMDEQKAMTLHDKYLNIKTDKPDGGNYWEIQRMNDRYTDFIGGSSGFTMRIKLKGKK